MGSVSAQEKQGQRWELHSQPWCSHAARPLPHAPRATRMHGHSHRHTLHTILAQVTSQEDEQCAPFERVHVIGWSDATCTATEQEEGTPEWCNSSWYTLFSLPRAMLRVWGDEARGDVRF